LEEGLIFPPVEGPAVRERPDLPGEVRGLIPEILIC
jgi:hypothetical protein